VSARTHVDPGGAVLVVGWALDDIVTHGAVVPLSNRLGIVLGRRIPRRLRHLGSRDPEDIAMPLVLLVRFPPVVDGPLTQLVRSVHVSPPDATLLQARCRLRAPCTLHLHTAPCTCTRTGNSPFALVSYGVSGRHQKELPMPAEFLRDVVRPPAASQSRAWSVLPLSIAVHAAGALAFFIIPLAAEEPPPAPLPASPALNIVEARSVPGPPPPPGTRRPAAPRVNPDAAPLVAPTSILPERPVEPADSWASAPDGVGVLGGVPGGLMWHDAVPAPAVAPPPPQPRQVYRPGGEINEPNKILHVPPVYPPIALSAGVQGVVILEATISETGAIENVRTLRSHPLLERAAVEAVKRWRYTPTRLNGQPVPIILTVTVNFMIER
jgi:protein TonB